MDKIDSALWPHYGIPNDVGRKYEAYVDKHIEAVREAGARLGISFIQMYPHDSSKWSSEEFPAYAMYFYGGDKPKYAEEFAKAWLHHIHHNPHHWEHWIFPQEFTLPNSNTVDNCLEMPHDYILEMVADWQGASFCQTGSWDITDWLQKQYPRLRLHPKTNLALLEILSNIGIKINGFNG